MINKVILVGRLGKEPETRYTNSGQAVCNFSMATDESYKDRAGEKKQKTEWHRIVVWGKLSEICQQYLKKGALVYIEGKLQAREWEDRRDNSKKQATEIVAFSMKMLGPKPNGGRQDAVSEDAENETGPQISDEDIPF